MGKNLKLNRKARPRKRKTLWVKLGNESQPIHPIGLEDGIRLCLLIAPYYEVITEQIKVLPKQGSKIPMLRSLVESMEDFPGDFIKMSGLVLGRSTDWLENNMSPSELFEVLVEVGEFVGMWELLVMGVKMNLIVNKNQNTDGESS